MNYWDSMTDPFIDRTPRWKEQGWEDYALTEVTQRIEGALHFSRKSRLMVFYGIPQRAR